MELTDVLLNVRLILFVCDAVDSSTGVLSKTPECLVQLLACAQVSDRVELPFRIFLGEFSYSVDVCGHIVSSSVSRYVSFQQIRTLASPSLQWVPWPPLAGALRFPTLIGTVGS